MPLEERNQHIEDYINDIALKYPTLFASEEIQAAIKQFKEIEGSLDEIRKKIDKIVCERIEFFKELETKFSYKDYQPKNIEEYDITNMSVQNMENLFYHFSLKRYLGLYDQEGIGAMIGENSNGIDPEKSIFFSKGLEGVLELWDVWLKWRLNRQNNPQISGVDGDFWCRYFKNKEYLNNYEMLRVLFEYQYAEMLGSDYFIMDLVEGADFQYDQIDNKKQAAHQNSQTGEINPIFSSMYGSYSDLTTDVVDKWNMQTIPGKNIAIEPSRLRRLTVNGKTDAYSIMRFMYEKYKREVPKDQQVTFDVLDHFVEYIDKKYHISVEETLTPPFDARSQTEIELYQQIKNKNNLIKQQKESKKVQEEGKVKVFTKTIDDEHGFINKVVLSLIISFICGVIFTIGYLIIGENFR